MFVIFYFVCKVVSSIKDVNYNTTFPYSKTERRREKCLILSRPIIHNNKTVATHRIILSGDIETKPKQTMKINPPKCSYHSISVATCGSCKNPVRSNAKRLMYSHCKSMAHLICSKLNCTEISNSHILATLTYSKCYFKKLPFSKL